MAGVPRKEVWICKRWVAYFILQLLNQAYIIRTGITRLNISGAQMICGNATEGSIQISKKLLMFLPTGLWKMELTQAVVVKLLLEIVANITSICIPNSFIYQMINKL
ncbi:hypothetical protein E3Q22_01008 [Wallemia mellicola]|uniref:Uncharacterized protein n=1 Tax=Wallemia mellicola TaxID=1708541 RepID=A0A4T0MEC7_9BASI|nr:hypothetical protein E3Q22_01008 [Wallemia mellicola]